MYSTYVSTIRYSSGPQSGTPAKWDNPQSGTKKRVHQKHVPLGILALLLLRSDEAKTSID